MAQRTLPDELKRRDGTRLAAYKKALDFYNGSQWPAVRSSARIRRLTLNYARTFVHKAASTTLKGRTIVVHPATDKDPSPNELAAADEVETALQQVWKDCALEALDFDTELDCAVLGDAAYKVFWSARDNAVRISAPDVAGIFIWPWPDDPSQFWKLANRYTLDEDGVNAMLPGFPAKATNEIVEAWALDAYELWLNNVMVDAGPNPYGFIPFVVFPNVREPKQLWGTSDLDTLYEPFNELNREVTQLSRILELSGNPIAALSGVDETVDVAVEPGALWTLPEKARAELLDLLRGGAVDQHINYLNAIYRILHDLAETPRAAFGDTGGRDLSGVALELELDPLVKKTDRKRLTRTPAYRRRNDMILALLDKNTGTSFTGARHDIAWGSVLPTDRDREVNNEVALVKDGIHSRRYAADILGGVDDPDAEFDRAVEEAERLPQPQQPPRGGPP